MERMTMAEEQGYNDSYFPREDPAELTPAEYILSSSPSGGDGVGTDLDVLAQDGEREREMRERQGDNEHQGGGAQQTSSDMSKPETEPEHHPHHDPGTHLSPDHPGYLEHTPSTALTPMDLPPHHPHHRHTSTQEAYTVPPSSIGPLKPRRRKSQASLNNVAEAIFFSYGVSVFFGFNETEEKEIMEDAETAGAWIRGLNEDDWEVEEFHYVVCNRHFLLGNPDNSLMSKTARPGCGEPSDLQ